MIRHQRQKDPSHTLVLDEEATYHSVYPGIYLPRLSFSRSQRVRRRHLITADPKAFSKTSVSSSVVVEIRTPSGKARISTPASANLAASSCGGSGRAAAGSHTKFASEAIAPQSAKALAMRSRAMTASSI